VPIEGCTLHDTSAQVITRLGRQLLPAPQSLVPVLKGYLEHSALRLSSIPKPRRLGIEARLLA
jgi:hypothetical protein